MFFPQGVKKIILFIGWKRGHLLLLLGSGGLLLLGSSLLLGSRGLALLGSSLLCRSLLGPSLEAVLLGVLLELLLGLGVHVGPGLAAEGAALLGHDAARLFVADQVSLGQATRRLVGGLVVDLGARPLAELVLLTVLGLVHLGSLGVHCKVTGKVVRKCGEKFENDVFFIRTLLSSPLGNSRRTATFHSLITMVKDSQSRGVDMVLVIGFPHDGDTPSKHL